MKRAVLHGDRDHALSQNIKRLMIDAPESDLGHEAGGKRLGSVAEGVAKSLSHTEFGFRVAEQGHGAADLERDGAKVVESVKVVGMVMGEEHGVDGW